MVQNWDGTRNKVNLGTLKEREETVEGSGMDNWNKEPVDKASAATGNPEDTMWFQKEGFWRRILEVKKQDVQWESKGDKPDVVEGSAPSNLDEETIHIFSVRLQNVGEPATRDRLVLLLKNNLDDDSARTCSSHCSSKADRAGGCGETGSTCSITKNCLT